MRAAASGALGDLLETRERLEFMGAILAAKGVEGHGVSWVGKVRRIIGVAGAAEKPAKKRGLERVARSRVGPRISSWPGLSRPSTPRDTADDGTRCPTGGVYASKLIRSARSDACTAWMAGTSPAMTVCKGVIIDHALPEGAKFSLTIRFPEAEPDDLSRAAY
ncbi:hypothetical protein SS37A_26360 [Methylocystis iwaonis]|uniref:Uncharacterized protein n=1 Tax=Methylocystis iwaonis TaxID=2885079 RepID=A0ABN6VJG5_9HYPH|nr:hypothetical protein SS37A_26360 [Methylocystis iwaonis]